MLADSTDALEFHGEDEGQRHLYQAQDGTTVITREDFISLTSGEREFTILCKDSEAGILPFLVAEDDTFTEDIFVVEDGSDMAHVCPELPVPKYFGLVDDDGYLEMSARGHNGVVLQGRFHWCVFTPFEEDQTGETYELRFATATKEDAAFVAEAFGCCDPLTVPIADESMEII